MGTLKRYIIISTFLTLATASLGGVGTNIGDRAPDIALPGPNGDTLRLSSLRGKTVLLHFWASWCGYCRIENYDLHEAYVHYKDRNFEIFSVSLDEKADKWKAAILEDSLSWKNHVSDLKQWKSPVAAQFGVIDTGTPYTFLINEDGIIVDKGINSLRLEKKLKWLFEDQLFFYPQKATTEIYFTEKTKYKILDFKSEEVLKGKGDKADIRSLEKGLYFVVYDGKKETLIKRNPSSESVTFSPKVVKNKITLSSETNYEIYNSRGKLVQKGRGTEVDLSSADLTSGSKNYLSINGVVKPFEME